MMQVHKLRTWALGVAAALLAAGVAWVQTPAADAPSLARFLPARAMLTLEARDCAGLFADWNASPEKQTWLASANYQVFSRSKLFGRLDRERQSFEAAAGVSLGADWVATIAGGETALGLYDIGDLRFVYVTEMPNARALETALWRTRASFEPRAVAGQTFYLRTDAGSGREAAFAVAGDRLMLATSADLAAQALTLLAGAGGAPVSAEDWYVETIAAAPARGELRLVHDLQALVRTPHFRSYWIQENVSDLRAYRSGVVDLNRSGESFREQRVLLKAPGEGPRAPAQSALAPLLARVPDEAGLYRVHTAGAAEAVALLQEKLLDPGPSGVTYSQYSYAPAAPGGASNVGSEAALETRIDQAPPERAAETFDPAPLTALLGQAGVTGVLQLQGHRPGPDGALPAHGACVFVQLERAASLEPFLQAVSASSAGLWTGAGLGASWEQDGEIFALEGLNPLYGWAGGSQLALSNSRELLLAALQDRATPPAAAADTVFAGGFRHGREAQLYQRTMARLDHLQGGGYNQGANREPQLFSENIASLSQSLERFVEVRVERRDLGERVDETIVYERRP